MQQIIMGTRPSVLTSSCYLLIDYAGMKGRDEDELLKVHLCFTECSKESVQIMKKMINNRISNNCYQYKVFDNKGFMG